jgi:hypothetical protein
MAFFVFLGRLLKQKDVGSREIALTFRAGRAIFNPAFAEQSHREEFYSH